METKNNTIAKGLRSLRKANILSIIGVILSVIGAIALAVGVGIGMAQGADLSAGAVGAAGVGGLITVIGLIITLVAGIMQIIALAKNSSAHVGYKTAFSLSIANVVLSVLFAVVGTLVSLPAIATQVIGAIGAIITFLVVYFVINTTVEILGEKGEGVVAAQGDGVRKVYTVCVSIMVVAYFITLVPVLAGAASMITFITSIVQLVALFKYIGFLGHAATALDK